MAQIVCPVVLRLSLIGFVARLSKNILYCLLWYHQSPDYPIFLNKNSSAVSQITNSISRWESRSTWQYVEFYFDRFWFAMIVDGNGINNGGWRIIRRTNFYCEFGVFKNLTLSDELFPAIVFTKSEILKFAPPNRSPQRSILAAFTIGSGFTFKMTGTRSDLHFPSSTLA